MDILLHQLINTLTRANDIFQNIYENPDNEGNIDKELDNCENKEIWSTI